MSYSFSDFFENELEPSLKELLSKECSTEDDRSDIFLRILGNAFSGKDKFSYILIKKIIDPYEENNSIEDAIKDFFYHINYSDDAELRKIEYSRNGAVIKVDYQPREEEE